MENEKSLYKSCDQLDRGPFYHGTKADLKVGDLLTPGFPSNYRPEVIMNHIYFTALINGAGLAAEVIAGEARERVYVVEPTGEFGMTQTSQIRSSPAILRVHIAR